MEAEAARRRRKGSEILPPNSASTGSSASLIPLVPFPFPFRPLLNTFDPPKILPSRRKQKLNVVAFISRWRLSGRFYSPLLSFLPPSPPCSHLVHFPLRGRLLQPSFADRTACVSVNGGARFASARHSDIFILWNASLCIVSYLRVSFGWRYNASSYGTCFVSVV